MNTQPRNATGPVRDYLRSIGWTPDEPGPAGEMWHRGSNAIAVPREMQQGSIEWRGVIDRIAAAEGWTPAGAAAAVFKSAGLPAGLYQCSNCGAAATRILAAGTARGTALTLLCEGDAGAAAAAATEDGADVRVLAIAEVPA